MRAQIVLLVGWLLLGTVPPAPAQDAGRFPFVLPWDEAGPSITRVADRNPTPAGGSGFVTARQGHFFDEKGRRIRFLGVNFTFSANFPDKPDAEKMAARLHQFGINIVRLHHMDMFHAPQGIFDPRYPDHRHLDPNQLDRLDYLVAQLKKQGIYCNINLHVSRAFTAADGFKETEHLPTFDKAVDFFEPRMIALQKEYARDLLTHRNPYTGTRYVDEPAVAVVEINNENTLLGEAWGDTLERLPGPYRQELVGQWNRWLKQRYADTAALRRAWGADDQPLGPELIRNGDFREDSKNWVLEVNTAPAAAVVRFVESGLPSGVAGKVARLEIRAVSGQDWHIQFDEPGLDLADGRPYTLSFWAKADQKRRLPVYASLDRDDWHQIGLQKQFDLGTDWQHYSAVFTAGATAAQHNRLVFVLGTTPGSVELAGVSLRAGVKDLLPASATLDAGTIPLGRPADSPAGRDWLAFLVDVEHNYLTTMRDYLKKDLGVRANVVGSQASYGGLGGLVREAPSDFIDMHAYWDHPHFPRRPWDPADWVIRNRPMVSDPQGGTLPDLAQYRAAGRAFTVSEYNHAAPNDYQAECVPLLAAFAALQDWDGIYLFDYNSDRHAWASVRIKGFFAVDSNPAKMAFLPAAACLFLRADVPPARNALTLEMPGEQVVPELARRGGRIQAEWEAVGVRAADALAARLEVALTAGERPAIHRRGEQRQNAQRRVAGAVRWQVRGPRDALFTVDASRSKVLVGFLGGQALQLGELEVGGTASGPRFAALTLTAMDSRQIGQSGSLLLTSVGRVENRGMEWNPERTSVGDHWGSAPTVCEGVQATVRLRTRLRSATVFALDGRGRRRTPIPSQLEHGVLTFDIGPGAKTLWYEVAANPS
jgi:hypothetical protein